MIDNWSILILGGEQLAPSNRCDFVNCSQSVITQSVSFSQTSEQLLILREDSIGSSSFECFSSLTSEMDLNRKNGAKQLAQPFNCFLVRHLSLPTMLVDLSELTHILLQVSQQDSLAQASIQVR